MGKIAKIFGGAPKLPKPPPPPVIPDKAAIAAEAERLKASKRKGRTSTIASGRGLLGSNGGSETTGTLLGS